MDNYEKLLDEATDDGLSVDEGFRFSGKLSGLYVDGNIALSDRLDTVSEKRSILAEEMGHHYTSSGNILDPSDLGNLKQERRARIWAYDRLIGLDGIIFAFEHNCRNRHEMASLLEVTEEFLSEALEYYQEHYGVGVNYRNYVIYFIPSLTIFKKF